MHGKPTVSSDVTGHRLFSQDSKNLATRSVHFEILKRTCESPNRVDAFPAPSSAAVCAKQQSADVAFNLSAPPPPPSQEHKFCGQQQQQNHRRLLQHQNPLDDGAAVLRTDRASSAYSSTAAEAQSQLLLHRDASLSSLEKEFCLQQQQQPLSPLPFKSNSAPFGRRVVQNFTQDTFHSPPCAANRRPTHTSAVRLLFRSADTLSTGMPSKAASTENNSKKKNVHQLFSSLPTQTNPNVNATACHDRNEGGLVVQGKSLSFATAKGSVSFSGASSAERNGAFEGGSAAASAAYFDAPVQREAAHSARKNSLSRASDRLEMNLLPATSVSNSSHTSFSSSSLSLAQNSADPLSALAFAQNLLQSSESANPTEVIPGKGSTKHALVKEALAWLRKLTATGSRRPPLVEACLVLGEIYEFGKYGVEIDHWKAFSLYVHASKQNDPAASHKVAFCYETATGTKKDNAKAVQFYRKASALGSFAAMHKLGCILLRGSHGVAKNPREGVAWLKRAVAISGNLASDAMFDLAACFEQHGNSSTTGVLIPDPRYAFDLYEKAAANNHPQALARLGAAYEYGQLGCDINPSLSISFYRRAAEAGIPEAELSLAGWYLTGAPGVLPASDVEAYTWARRSADRCFGKAEYALGHFSENGIGVEQNIEEAKRWYQRAVSHGYKRAVERLAQIKKASDKRFSRKAKFCTIV